MPRMLETMRETFWILALAVIALFAFFAALGAFSPTEVIWATIVVAVLCALWIVHAVARGPPPRPPRPGGRARASAASVPAPVVASLRGVLDPEIQPIVDLMEAAPGPPAHLVPVEQARAGARMETAEISGPGEEVAEVRELEVPGPGRPDPRPRVSARWRRATGRAAARRLPARRRLGDRLARRVRPALPRAGQRVRRGGREHRLPARARAPVPGRGRRRARRGALAGRARARARRRPGADRRSPATRPAATSRRSRRAGCATRAARRCASRRSSTPSATARSTPRPTASNGAGFGLSAASMKRYWELYLDGADGRQPDASPLQAGRSRRAAARVRADRPRRRAARRGRGVRARARGRRRAGDAAPLRRRGARLLPLAGEGGVARRAVAEAGAALRAALGMTAQAALEDHAERRAGSRAAGR